MVLRLLTFAAAGLFSLLLASPVFAQNLIVPIIEQSEGDLDTCGFGEVYGLKANGDGFLAVRAGPDSSFPKLDEIHNGDKVWIFQQNGAWLGVAYGSDNIDCSPIHEDQRLNKTRKEGWVHENWIRFLAG